MKNDRHEQEQSLKFFQTFKELLEKTGGKEGKKEGERERTKGREREREGEKRRGAEGRGEERERERGKEREGKRKYIFVCPPGRRNDQNQMERYNSNC